VTRLGVAPAQPDELTKRVQYLLLRMSRPRFRLRIANDAAGEVDLRIPVKCERPSPEVVTKARHESQIPD
jgi:hypothetical protein